MKAQRDKFGSTFFLLQKKFNLLSSYSQEFVRSFLEKQGENAWGDFFLAEDKKRKACMLWSNCFIHLISLVIIWRHFLLLLHGKVEFQAIGFFEEWSNSDNLESNGSVRRPEVFNQWALEHIVARRLVQSSLILNSESQSLISLFFMFSFFLEALEVLVVRSGMGGSTWLRS